MVRLDVTLLQVKHSKPDGSLSRITRKSMKGGVRILRQAVATQEVQFTSRRSCNLQTARSIFLIRMFVHSADTQKFISLQINLVYSKLCPGHGIIIAHPRQHHTFTI